MFKKTVLTLPEAWPLEARELYRDFEGQLSQRILSARAYFLRLHDFFRYQERQGLSFRDFPQTLIDFYLEPLTMCARAGAVVALSAWLRFLFARQQLLLPLHNELVPPKVHYRRRTLLSHGQVLQLLGLPQLDEPEGLRDRAYFEMAYATAMRRGELVRLDLSDIDLTSGLVTIRQGKNGYQRNVPLTHWAIHFLFRYLREARPQLTSPLSSNALWLNHFGRRIARDWGNTRLKKFYRVEETLGFPITLHLLRHAAATHLLVNGAPLRAVQEFLGHRVPNSTQIYTHITPTHLSEVHDRCHPRNNRVWPKEDEEPAGNS